ncbi:hypothetical protein EES46_32575 [Streptomyces sp. ADI98-10]|nr:hypothetical protein EES46_32575 [Streptomyces sp. ADI98-10]
MLDLFTRLAGGGIGPDAADRLGRTLILLHEGALVAHGLKVFPDPVAHARDEAASPLAEAAER